MLIYSFRYTKKTTFSGYNSSSSCCPWNCNTKKMSLGATCMSSTRVFKKITYYVTLQVVNEATALHKTIQCLFIFFSILNYVSWNCTNVLGCHVCVFSRVHNVLCYTPSAKRRDPITQNYTVSGRILQHFWTMSEGYSCCFRFVIFTFLVRTNPQVSTTRDSHCRTVVTSQCYSDDINVHVYLTILCHSNDMS